MTLLGGLHEDGCGVPPDFAKAAEFYRRAADAGFEMAQYRLGVLLAAGRGVPRDRDAAVRYLRSAAEQGSDEARECLGRLQA
jgi:TPR repeat protein